MTMNHPVDNESLRAQIASAAARLVAEDGADYSTAKRKAAKQILGDVKVRSDILPDNRHIEDEVRIYNELFLRDTQPARLQHLRKLALQLMIELEQFTPYLTGAVLNGTAGKHSDIHLQLFGDNPKDVEIFLLNKNICFKASLTPHFKGRANPVETLSFVWQNEGIHLSLYATDDLHGAVKLNNTGRIERGSLHVVRALVLEKDIK